MDAQAACFLFHSMSKASFALPSIPASEIRFVLSDVTCYIILCSCSGTRLALNPSTNKRYNLRKR